MPEQSFSVQDQFQKLVVSKNASPIRNLIASFVLKRLHLRLRFNRAYPVVTQNKSFWWKRGNTSGHIGENQPQCILDGRKPRLRVGSFRGLGDNWISTDSTMKSKQNPA